MNRRECRRIATAVGKYMRGRVPRAYVVTAIRSAPVDWDRIGDRGTWAHHLDRLALWIDRTDWSSPPFRIFTDTNRKVPFTQFSALPLITCPGAGDCARWCYSFKAWRYPAAFCRQIQNTMLLHHPYGRDVIREAWEALPTGIDVRLYVDGDIDSIETLRFWMGRCFARPDLRVYGYSKSWGVFAQHEGPWPSNYMVNGSSGSRYSPDSPEAETLRSLPIYRGDFRVVDDTPKPGPGTFVCPGSCGDCTPMGHACGLDSFRGITILEAIH